MAPTTASPMTWTLIFKNGKSTTLLHADPLQSFDTLKEELFRALRETHPDGRINGLEIPSEASNILLAKPNDIHDLEKGFTSVTDGYGNIILEDERVGSKRKGGETALKIKDACPKAAGLKDGVVLAYKFRAMNQTENYDPVVDEDWDVVLPNFDDPEASP